MPMADNLWIGTFGLLFIPRRMRSLDTHISELETRVAFPKHWRHGEHLLDLVKLQQLTFEKTQAIQARRAAR